MAPLQPYEHQRPADQGGHDRSRAHCRPNSREHSCNPEGSGAREPCRFLATQARGTYGRRVAQILLQDNATCTCWERCLRPKAVKPTHAAQGPKAVKPTHSDTGREVYLLLFLIIIISKYYYYYLCGQRPSNLTTYYAAQCAHCRLSLFDFFQA